MSSRLLSGGDTYNFLVNWPKRLSIEIPFLIDEISDRLTSESALLSVGCGTGQHLFELQKHCKCNITGLDIDESMIKKAKQEDSNINFIASDFLDRNTIMNRKFDVIFSLGNSIGLIASESGSFNQVVKKLETHLSSNGILIFQILNTMKERNGWSTPRQVRTESGEYVFLRGFTTSERFVHPEIITLFRSNDEEEFHLDSTGRANIPRISVQNMTLLLEEANFSNIHIYGDYFKGEFNKQSSADMIFVAKR